MPARCAERIKQKSSKVNMNLPLPFTGWESTIRAIKIQVWYVHKFSRTCFFLAYCCKGSLMMFDAVSQFSPSLLNWTSHGSHDFDLIRHHFHTMANLCVGHPYWAAPSMLQPATAPKHKANRCASQTCGWTPSNNPSFISRHTPSCSLSC